MTGKQPRKRARRVWFPVLLALLFFVISASQDKKCESSGPSSPYALDYWPVRQKTELHEFELCELDRETLEQLSPCVPAEVPGDVFTALMKADRIPDPYRDMNSKDVQWVDERAWRYRTGFQYERTRGKRAWLSLAGLDYISRIELNGEVLVERHEGMFSRVELDITEHLKDGGTQELEVTLFGMGEGPDESRFPGILAGLENEIEMRDNLKTPMSTGWDFSPELKGAGIKDGVFLHETGPVRVKDIFVKPELSGELDIEVDLEGEISAKGDKHVPSRLMVKVDAVNFDMKPITKSVSLKPGNQGEVNITMQVPDPKLWWPWDMGEQNLMYAQANAIVDGSTSDTATESFGIREIEWKPAPGAPDDWPEWVLYVNGKRAFMRGANWVPPEAMYGRSGKDRYKKLLTMAKEANINLVRVWGGGNRERRVFYDYCDQMGLMVWQEFPFACVFASGYSRSESYKDVVRQEVSEIVRQLRNHASLIMWCGGNEFNIKTNRHVVKIMENKTGKLDPTRRFLPSSPVKGDSHNWVVWHSKGNLADYFDDVSPVVSEFGLQSFPEMETLKKYVSEDHLWPVNNEVLKHHNMQFTKLNKYVSVIGHENNIESYAEASQTMQAHYMKRGIEHWRQRKYRTTGTAFWMLNDPWPAISWSVIDYELKPKASYEAVKQAYQPVLVTAAYENRRWKAGDEFKARLMIVNDLHESFENARVTTSLCGEQGAGFDLTVAEDSLTKAGKLQETIPAGCERPVLELRLVQDEKELSRSSYNLWIHDPEGAGAMGRASTDFTHYIMTGVRPERWKD
ncbi:MAG: glycoside hydrolase family 2 TIM barrel-domain containing protein [bacterium]